MPPAQFVDRPVVVMRICKVRFTHVDEASLAAQAARYSLRAERVLLVDLAFASLSTSP
jgi:hypothetical protein